MIMIKILSILLIKLIQFLIVIRKIIEFIKKMIDYLVLEIYLTESIKKELLQFKNKIGKNPINHSQLKLNLI